MHTAHPLPAELTIHEATAIAGALHTWWAAQAATPDTVLRLDGQAVRDIDGAGLQLIASLQRSALERQQVIEVLDPSPVLARALALFQPALTHTTPATEEPACH